MMLAVRVSGLLRTAVGQQVSRASIVSKPAKHVITVAEKAFVLTTMFITILGPSGYILIHLKDYKK